MAKAQRPSRVFISYTHESPKHRAWVHQLAKRLQGDAISVWLDDWEVRPGQDWASEIENAISNSQCMIAICTPSYKKQAERRVGLAIESALLDYFGGKQSIKLIPVLRSGTWYESSPPWLMSHPYVDLTAEPLDEKGYRSLLQTLTSLPHENSLVSQSTGLVVELTIDTDFNAFTSEAQVEFLAALRSLLSPQGQIRVLAVTKGSTKVILELTQQQTEQLFWLYKRGVLNELGIKGAKVVGDAVAAALIEEKSQANKYDVFMCHNSEDRNRVRALALRLLRDGILPWLDEWELRPGLPWQTALEKQIQSIASAAICVGSSGVGPWQDMEIYAFIRQFVARSCPVIPVILRGCRLRPKLPVFLNGMTWVDFNKRRPDPYERLIWGIAGARGKPQIGWGPARGE